MNATRQGVLGARDRNKMKATQQDALGAKNKEARGREDQRKGPGGGTGKGTIIRISETTNRITIPNDGFVARKLRCGQ